MVNLKALRPPWVTATGNQELRHPSYNARFGQAMLNFFPHYSDVTVENMKLNIMAHWHVGVDENLNFKQMTYRADMVEADIKKRNEELAKQKQKRG